MATKVLKVAQIGYGMFGSDVVAGTMCDLQRNGIAPYLGRLGLDDWAADYANIRIEMLAIGTHTESSAQRAVAENEAHTGTSPLPYFGEAPWEAMLDDLDDLDVLIVATPDHLHAAPITCALERGVHVITEKPMCLRLHEARRIAELTERNDLIVGVDMHKRYDPDHLEIFRHILPELGSPIFARGVLEEPLEVSTQIFEWVEHSDPFTYVGIHWVDLFCHYLGLQPLALYAVGVKKRLREEFGKDAFDATQVVVTHTDGTVISYENNWLTPADFESNVNQESALLGEYGKVESDSQYRGLRYWIENKGSRTRNTHFFRQVERPDGTMASVGYGKDSLIDCFEKICRCKFLDVSANALAGTYPDAASQLTPTAIIEAARQVLAANQQRIDAGQPPTFAVAFDGLDFALH